MYSPLFSKQQCKDLLQKYSLVPVARHFSLNFDTSLSVFLKLNGDYLLESAESGDAMGRFSFVGRGIHRKFVLCANSVQDYVNTPLSAELTCTKYDNLKNPLEYVQQVMSEYKPPKDELYRFPPFWGGLIGYLGYETVGYYEDIEQLYDKPGLDIPDGILVIPQQLLVIDHLRRVLWIVGIIENINQYEAVEHALRESWNRINRVLPEYMQQYNMYVAALDDIEHENMIDKVEWESSINKEDYILAVEHCKECILKGDIIQVVFSRQLKTKFLRDRELLLYMRLRNINPSPYMYFLRFDEFSIVGSSPEVMTSLSLDRTMMIKPIAGTIRRGVTQLDDIALQKKLLADEKEKAEHIMLVDLGRNDLHRIAVPGTVHVPKYMVIEGYSHVYHIVSTVEGTLQDGKDGFDLIKATFPAGTLSGAPKIEAMNIIGHTEPLARKAYGGLIMAMGFNGYLDSCITIRTAVLKNDMVYLQAGAGIVADSIPEKEWEETQLKLEALVHTIETVESQANVIGISKEI